MPFVSACYAPFCDRPCPLSARHLTLTCLVSFSQIFEKRWPWKFIKSFGAYGHSASGKNEGARTDCTFAHAAGLAVDNSKDGLLYVADTHNYRISAYDKDG